MVMVAPDPGVPARRPDGAARRDRRRRNADLLSVRGQRQGALRPRQGRRRRDRAGHRGRGHRRSRLFLPRSRRTPVEFRHPQSVEHASCRQQSPGVAPHLEGPRRRASCLPQPAPSIVHKPARDVASDLALTILDKVSTSIEPAQAEQTPDRAGDDAALRDMRDQLSKERLARVAADRQVSDIREAAGAGAPRAARPPSFHQRLQRGPGSEPRPSRSFARRPEGRGNRCRRGPQRARQDARRACGGGRSSSPRPRRPSRLPNRAPRTRASSSHSCAVPAKRRKAPPARCASSPRASAVRASRQSAR